MKTLSSTRQGCLFLLGYVLSALTSFMSLYRSGHNSQVILTLVDPLIKGPKVITSDRILALEVQAVFAKIPRHGPKES